MPPAQDLPSKARLERRLLRDLKPHPDCTVFAEPLDHEIATLAADIESRSLQHRIEISPCDVIIAGRRRWLALQRIGRQSTTCIVRYDLAMQGEAAIVEHLVKDNILRRHHTPLEIARGHHILALGRDHGGPSTEMTGRSAVAQHLNLSGAELSHLCRAVTTPRAIQDAVDSGAMRIADAAKVSLMPVTIQGTIASDILYGEPPDEVFRRSCDPMAMRQTKVGVTVVPSSPVRRAAADLADCEAQLLRCADADSNLAHESRKVIADVARRLTAILRQS